ncbi:hypothetical protein [Mucilaginibacter gotjawali]|uniref:Uncharacterized protein n=2 Tax=Mucilaginibacter gotjawali TaxID=1550579 RepID=A0A110B0P9_9SPHI|nr:hypothetical protein [Mucilaginibacter gotjawali]MBB3057927.1 hypothetical protein [Mucilaginibacter gotjawali]BAU52301.1 hypothetical protein MgSA37_00456 [Mucilaginibacter gotjawali]
MDFQALPIGNILLEINNQPDPVQAFKNILNFCDIALSSKIWETFRKMDLQKDAEASTIWLQQTIDEFSNTKGIYLGLDTLNMENGSGSNVEIGLNSDCDPSILSDGWTYDCDNYGESHLIEGLWLVSDSFISEERWSDDERRFSEYTIFLGYSGLVLREALLNLKTNNDFISIWGFHDGDMFFLVNKKDGKMNLIANTDS